MAAAAAAFNSFPLMTLCQYNSFIITLWVYKCCDLWPQQTMAAFGHEQLLCELSNVVVFGHNTVMTKGRKQTLCDINLNIVFCNGILAAQIIIIKYQGTTSLKDMQIMKLYRNTSFQLSLAFHPSEHPPPTLSLPPPTAPLIFTRTKIQLEGNKNSLRNTQINFYPLLSILIHY